MSDVPELTWPGSPEVEALVSRAVAERIDPLRAQLETVSRALTILAERVAPPQEESEVSRRVDALAAMIHEATPAAEALADLERAVIANRAEVAKLASLERTLQDGLAELGAKVSLSRDAEAREAQAEELRQTVATAVEQTLARVQAARAADATRVLEVVSALEAPLQREAEERRAQTEELRQALSVAVAHAVAKIDQARSAEATVLGEQVATVADALAGDAEGRSAQAEALRRAVAEAIEQTDARTEAARAADLARLADQVAALEDGLLARIDERTAAITDLESIPPLVASEVQNATAAALTGQVQPLVARLVEAIDALAYEGGRIEAMAKARAGEARAVEDRVATLFVEVAERAESAVDHSRARISEGQVALATKIDAIMSELLTSISAVAERLEVRLAESAEGLRSASGHQNGALLDAVNRSSHQVVEGLTEVRSALYATGTEWASRGAEGEQRAVALAERLEALRATVDSIRQDPRLEALVVEQVAAREAQLTAIEAVASRIDGVGPVVAGALLSEVERATRAANAAEEAVASLRPETLRSVLGDAADELLTLTTRAIERSVALADEVASTSGTALDDLRASQTVLREAVEDGAHKAELAAVDIRGLRERLIPHLVALADATTRRADADQAGFDAVLARLDQLLAARQR